MSRIALSGVPELRTSGEAVSPQMRRTAVAAALGLHLAVFLWLIDPWRNAREHAPPPAMPVTLVFEPPPKPPPPPAPPKPQAPQPPPQAQPDYRESGPDTKTTAPPQPTEPEPVKSEAKPAEEPTPAPREALAVPPPPPAPAVTPLPPTPPASKPEPPRPAARPKEEKPPGPQHPPLAAPPAPHPPTRMKNAAQGDQLASGDPYFNALRAEIEKHRFYPELARPLGLVGTARFDMKIDRTGRIVALRLQESSGTELIDRAAEKMIRDTARFPPPPSDIPGDFILIWIELPIHPM